MAFAAHNRGVANHFGKIHTLSIGDKITYTTKLGTRTYEVYSVSKISVNDAGLSLIKRWVGIFSFLRIFVVTVATISVGEYLLPVSF